MRPAGRSICVMSPVMTAFEPKPRRVRNIFICSEVVFCASSRMTNASLSVRPRMNAIGATSIVPALEQPLGALDLHHVVERVVQRPQVRVHLFLQVARQEPELLPRFDRGPREDDAADRFASRNATACAIARYVLPVPAGPMPKTMSCCSIASR